ncbi:MAG: type II toxin-antitoxin system PemK/MazF family toxin [Leifsonia sp.]
MVVIPFPYADLTGVKRRPAVVVAEGDRGDLVLCQITSRPYAAASAISLDNTSFVSGGLPRASFVRPSKLFTGNTSLVIRTAGVLRQEVSRTVLARVRQLFDE